MRLHVCLVYKTEQTPILLAITFHLPFDIAMSPLSAKALRATGQMQRDQTNHVPVALCSPSESACVS